MARFSKTDFRHRSFTTKTGEVRQEWIGNTYDLRDHFNALNEGGEKRATLVDGVRYTRNLSKDEIAWLYASFRKTVLDAPASDRQQEALAELVEGGYVEAGSVTPDLTYGEASKLIGKGRKARTLAEGDMFADPTDDANADGF